MERSKAPPALTVRIDAVGSQSVDSRPSKWRSRLSVERAEIERFEDLDLKELSDLLCAADPLSANHDTVYSLDWPHYCSFATEACGGARGWCYTFSGFHVSRTQAAKVAANDVMARRLPALFARRVVDSVQQQVRAGRLHYPNLRFSGSGEITLQHIPALAEISKLGVNLWGFTKNPAIASRLAQLGVAVIFSSDHTSEPKNVAAARSAGVPIAYSSIGAGDRPPDDVLVTFPVHVSGRVTEVVDHPSVCPKVVDEFLHGTRVRGWCQDRCRRCHLGGDGNGLGIGAL